MTHDDIIFLYVRYSVILKISQFEFLIWQMLANITQINKTSWKFSINFKSKGVPRSKVM